MTVVKGQDARERAANAVVLDFGDVEREAEAIIAVARERAEAIMTKAREKAQAIVARGQAAGEERGFEVGRAAGIEEGRTLGREAARKDEAQALAALQASWTEALDAWQGERDAMQADAESSIMELALAIAQRIVLRIPQVDPTVVAEQLRESIELAGRPSRMVIEVAPDDRQLVEEVLPAIVGRLGDGDADARLEENPEMARGGVVVRTDAGRVDASLERQLDRITEALLPPPPSEKPS